MQLPQIQLPQLNLPHKHVLAAAAIIAFVIIAFILMPSGNDEASTRGKAATTCRLSSSGPGTTTGTCTR